MKSDIVYSRDLLYVDLRGNVYLKDYKKLKKKISYIINEYEINGIVLNVQNSQINDSFLIDFKNSFNNATIKR